jgi:hypothetical protein
MPTTFKAQNGKAPVVEPVQPASVEDTGRVYGDRAEGPFVYEQQAHIARMFYVFE